ncbi:MAG: O-antigen ligase family protein, partial [Endomicrobiales bacterium]
MKNKINTLLLMFLLLFSPMAYGSVLPGSMAVIEVTAGVMMLIWLSSGRERNGSKLPEVPGKLFFSLFVLYGSVQFLAGCGMFRLQGLPFATAYPYATRTELMKIIAYILLFIVTLHTVKTKRQVLLIILTIVAVGFVSGVISLMRDFGKNAPRTLINPDHFAGYLGMILPLGLGLILAGKEAGLKHSRVEKHVLLLFCITIIAAALLFTMSRGGMFSIMGAFFTMGIFTVMRKALRKKSWIMLPMVIFIVLIVAWLGATPVIEKAMSIKAEVTSHYFNGRWPIWMGTKQLIKDNYVFGTGLGTFPEVFPKYQPEKIIRKHYAHAHSDYMEILSDTGIIGFLLFLAGAVVLLISLLRKYLRQKDTYIIGLSIGFWGALASIGIHSLADFNLHIPANAVLLSAILALFIATLNLQSSLSIEGNADAVVHKNNKVSVFFYPALAVTGLFYILFAAKPALADYYYRKAASTGTTDPGLLEKAVTLDPQNASYHFAAGKEYYREGKIVPALGEYQKASQLNPNDSKYFQSLAWTYGQLANTSPSPGITDNKCHALARRYFEKAISLNPNNPYCYRAYAIYLLNKDSEHAKILYKKAIAMMPSLTEEALGLYIKSLRRLETVNEILPGTEKSDLNAFSYIS